MNHLLIGLGGTGGRVLRSFRKLAYQAFRENIPDSISIDYLFVDSDPKSFRSDDPGWTVLGKSVGLSKRSQLPIQQANLRAVVDDLNSHPNLKQWLGDKKDWGELLASLNIDSAGGQKRRLGRFLFAMSARRFQESVTTLVRDMQAQGSRSTETTFHIFAGLAGGTGSGSVIDAVAQLRKIYPDSRESRIIVYAYLPDMNPPVNWNTGNYHANAYAALLELNAMSAGVWSPFDVADGGAPIKRDFWFNGCYAFTDGNEQGYRTPIDGELTDILADFVFHKVIVARKVSWDDLSRFENSENGDAAPESIAGSGRGQRSVRFLSFGIRRLSFPEETIREYLTYDFVVQALRQLQHNNWLDGLGFSDRPRPQVDAEFVSSSKQKEVWCISDDHLKLTRPIIETDASKRWRPVEQEWQQWESHYISLAQNGKKIEWLAELKKLFQSAMERSYRTAGIKQFFSTYERDLRNLAVAMRDKIELSLFENWKVGDRSLSEAGRVVDALLLDLDARRVSFDLDLPRREQVLSDLQLQIQGVEHKWHQIGLLGSVVLSSYEKTLVQAGLLMRDVAILSTHIEALRFAKRLIGELSVQLTDLKSSIDTAENSLANAADESIRIMQSRAPKDAAKSTGAQGITGTYVLKLEDGKNIDSVRRKLSQNEAEQRTQTASVRAKIIAALGPQPTFRVFSTRLASSEMRNAIVSTCESNVEIAHQRLITQKEERVLKVSLIEKLQHEWGASSERIRREADTLVRSAGRFLTFDETEVNKHFDGKSSSPRATEAFAVMLPEPADQKEFVGQLKEAFKNARNATSGPVTFIPMEDRGNEITLVTLVNLFPLRFAKIVRDLREKYQARIEQYGRARTVLEVHSEGDGTQFPDLFVADGVVIRNSARSILLLGDALDLVVQSTNQATGQQQLVILRKDDDGFDMEPILLGKSLLQALDKVTEKIVSDLRDAILEKIRPPKFSREEDLVALREKLQSLVATIKAELNGDTTHSEFVAWNQAARDVMKIARKEVEL